VSQREEERNAKYKNLERKFRIGRGNDPRLRPGRGKRKFILP